MQITFIVLLALIPSITTLKCYVCNSVNDADCANPNTLSAFEKLCTESVDPHCRTISQSVNGEKSIVRLCGSKSSSKSCYKTAGVNNAYVCSCNTDLCNSAPNFNRYQQAMTVLSSIIFMAISMFMLR